MLHPYATLVLCCLSCTIAVAQEYQAISTGTGYQKQSFVHLAEGTETQVSDAVWDIAFTVSGQDAGIFINESSGTSMGTSLPGVELYDAMTGDFDAQPDPGALMDHRLYNDEISWQYGAFNALLDPEDPTDYGWGYYDSSSGQVIGLRVFVVKLRNGQYRKLKIESLNNGVFTFFYAQLDGSDLQTRTIDQSEHAGKTLAYFSLNTGETVDVEPAGGFDLLYCRYIAALNDPGTGGIAYYHVTGILSGPGVQVAEADGVDPSAVVFADYEDSLQSRIDIIGHDWKSFASNAWTLDQDRVFFVKTATGNVWQIRFVDFEGSLTGTVTFEKTDLGGATALILPDASGWEAAIYPNPLSDHLFVALEIPGGSNPGRAQLELVDLQGRICQNRQVTLTDGFQVFNLPAMDLSPGMYWVRMVFPESHFIVGKVIR